jgi:CHASE3 domain sensor protein
MIDPITAMAAVSKAVDMIKKASSTVDDVASLGPLIGKYFDAKHTATKAARDAKKSGGSNMGKAIEIELAIKAQKDFEEQLKGMFFSTNNMDVWNSIQVRVMEMNKEDREEERREAARAANAAKRRKELIELGVGITLITVICIIILYLVFEVISYCSSVGCG